MEPKRLEPKDESSWLGWRI